MKSCVVVLWLAIPLSLSAGERKVSVTGIFSDLRYAEDIGDLVGAQMFIVPSSSGHFVYAAAADSLRFAALAAEPPTVRPLKHRKEVALCDALSS